MKKLITFLIAAVLTIAQAAIELLPVITFNALVGFAIAMAVQAPAMPIIIVAMLIGVCLGFAKRKFSITDTNNMAFAGLAKEIWLDQLMERFYSNWDFMNGVDDMSMFVNNNTINLAEAGVNPNVLVNNTSYPVATAERTDAALALALEYLDTENTVVRNAVAKQRAYNLMESVLLGHRTELSQKCAERAAHHWAPSADGSSNVVFNTSGADKADGSGRKVMRLQDIARMQKKYDLLRVPKKGRVMVLHPEHKEDICNQDAGMFKAFSDLKSGEILPIYGFETTWTDITPTYNGTALTKKAIGAAAAPSTDSPSTIFFHKNEVMKAEGSLDMFYTLKSPTERGDVIGFQKFFIALSKRNKFSGAIVSGIV